MLMLIAAQYRGPSRDYILEMPPARTMVRNPDIPSTPVTWGRRHGQEASNLSSTVPKPRAPRASRPDHPAPRRSPLPQSPPIWKLPLHAPDSSNHPCRLLAGALERHSSLWSHVVVSSVGPLIHSFNSCGEYAARPIAWHRLYCSPPRRPRKAYPQGAVTPV